MVAVTSIVLSPSVQDTESPDSIPTLFALIDTVIPSAASAVTTEDASVVVAVYAVLSAANSGLSTREPIVKDESTGLLNPIISLRASSASVSVANSSPSYFHEFSSVSSRLI